DSTPPRPSPSRCTRSTRSRSTRRRRCCSAWSRQGSTAGSRVAASTTTPGESEMYQLPEEHEELRAAVRALAEKEIAPHATEVDEQERFPDEALTALTAAGFNAVHIPEEYSGQGADAVAACIVI